jgi:hypothetical protein
VRYEGKRVSQIMKDVIAPGRWRTTSSPSAKGKKDKNERDQRGKDKEGVERSKLRRSRQDQGGDENLGIITWQGLTPKSTSPLSVASQ